MSSLFLLAFSVIVYISCPIYQLHVLNNVLKLVWWIEGIVDVEAEVVALVVEELGVV